MRKVLLVDDDVVLTSMLTSYLERESFEVDAVHDGPSGIAKAVTAYQDIIVLDVMMPGMSGLETLQRIRHRSTVPILMLSARGDDIDRIIGLDSGADDYVMKPCMPREVVSRIRAILRRTELQGSDCLDGRHRKLEAGKLCLFPTNRTATWKGKPLELTGTEFNLLEILTINAGRLLTKHEISQKAFGKALEPFDRRIDVHISSIRQKLGARSDGCPWILGVRGVGYQLLVD